MKLGEICFIFIETDSCALERLMGSIVHWQYLFHLRIFAIIEGIDRILLDLEKAEVIVQVCRATASVNEQLEIGQQGSSGS